MDSTGYSKGSATTATWAGRSGLELLLEHIDVRVADPSRFRADQRRFVVDGLRLTDWRSSPLTISIPDLAGLDGRSVTLLLVARGRIRYRIDDRVFTGGAGSVHLVSGGDRVEADLLETSRLLAVTIPVSQLSASLRGAQPARSGAIESSVYLPSLTVLLGSLLGPRDAKVPGLYGIGALRALVTAVLTEQVPPEAGDIEGLRRSIVQYVELHLTDPDLVPRAIAEAFDVSLRWVHQVFDTGDESLARFIREHRVDAVALAVRSDLRLPRVAALAAEFGFAGRDQLNRAFHARYGMSVHEYQELAALGKPLPRPHSHTLDSVLGPAESPGT